MDVTALLSSVAPQAGIGGLLLVLLTLTMRNASTDRGEYRQALTDARTRHATERDELQARLDAQEAKTAEAWAAWEAERTKRWAAEAEAEQARRGSQTW